MARHRCNISKNQTFLYTPATRTVSLHACVNMCCVDLRPFDTIADEGLLDLVQEVSNMNIIGVLK